MNWLILIILIIVIALILVYFFKNPQLDFLNPEFITKPKFSENLIVDGSSEDTELQEKVCEKIKKYIKKFMQSDLTNKKIRKINLLKEDLVSSGNIDIKLSKIILEIIPHAYIYDKNPNKISRHVIQVNLKKLKPLLSKKSCFDMLSSGEKLTDFNYKVNEILDKNKKNESESDSKFIMDLIFDENFTQLSSKEIESLKNDLSRKNIEIRECRDEINKSRYSNSSSSYSGYLANSIDALRLQTCEKDKLALQEKIYELKRDLDSARSSGVSSVELSNLRNRLEECLQQNTQITNNSRAELARLQQDLADCHMIVNALNT